MRDGALRSNHILRDAPWVGMLIQGFLQPLVQFFALAEEVIQADFTEHRS